MPVMPVTLTGNLFFANYHLDNFVKFWLILDHFRSLWKNTLSKIMSNFMLRKCHKIWTKMSNSNVLSFCSMFCALQLQVTHSGKTENELHGPFSRSRC